MHLRKHVYRGRLKRCCLTGVSEEELSRLSITYVDGRSDEWQSAPEFFGHL
jgi:hypothetical protein